MRTSFPQYLSSPFQVLWFESDELGLILMFITLAMVYGGICYLFIIAGPWAYKSFKKRYPRGFLKHSFYFMGFASMDGYPSFFEKTFIE